MDLQVQIDALQQVPDVFISGEGVEDPQGVAVAEAISPQILGNRHQLDQKREIGAARIFASHRHIEIMALGKIQGHLELLLDPLPAFAQLAPDVKVGNRQGDVDRLHPGVDRGLDVGNHRPVPGDEPGVKPEVDQGLHAPALLGPHGRDAAFQFADADLVEHQGDALFLREGKDHPRRLLAVAQGGVVDDDFFTRQVVHGRPPRPKEKPRESWDPGAALPADRQPCRTT